MTITSVRGFKDILPGESEHWQWVESKARQVLRAFGLREIRLPVLEKTELFARGIGEHTDIVEKEMYTFLDRSDDSLTLRPEATAGLLRAIIEHKLNTQALPLKLFTIGPMFRHERPQKGRLRQFHQINVEILGTDAPIADAEIIWLAWEILGRLGAEEFRLEINSLGCTSCRPSHREDLLLYLEGVRNELCSDCQRRSLTSPLRVFDCKQEGCRKAMARAPLIKHCLCPACLDHLKQVLDHLESLEVPFSINPHLVRGLDYYTRTTFEIISPRLGAQSTVAAGGRYDGLVQALGGPDLPGVGMAIGVERFLLLLDMEPTPPAMDLFVAALGPEARKGAIPWVRAWRERGLVTGTSYEDKGLKAQLKQANRAGARFVLIVGENELKSGRLIVRNMLTREQQEVPLENAVDAVKGAVR